MDKVFTDALDYLKSLVENKKLGEAFTNEIAPEVEKLEHEIYNPELKIAMIGEFSAGKSTVLNALLGTRFLAMADERTTAVNTYIRYGKRSKAVVYFKGVSPKTVSFSDLKKYVKEGEQAGEVEKVEIQTPSELLKNNVVLIDTPGANAGLDRHDQMRDAAVEDANATIFVISAQGIATVSCVKLINDHKNDLGKFIFVMNKADTLIDTDSIDDVVENAVEKNIQDIRTKIKDKTGISCRSIHAISAKGFMENQTNPDFDVAGTFNAFRREIMSVAQRDSENIIAYKISRLLKKILPQTAKATENRSREVEATIRKIESENAEINNKKHEIKEHVHQFVTENTATVENTIPNMIYNDYMGVKSDVKEYILSITDKKCFKKQAWLNQFNNDVAELLNNVTAHINGYISRENELIGNGVRSYIKDSYQSFFTQLNLHYKELNIEKRINQRSALLSTFIFFLIAGVLFGVSFLFNANIIVSGILSVLIWVMGAISLKNIFMVIRKKDFTLNIRDAESRIPYYLPAQPIRSDGIFSSILDGIGSLISGFFADLQEEQEKIIQSSLEMINKAESEERDYALREIQNLKYSLINSANETSDMYYAQYTETMQIITQYNTGKKNVETEKKSVLGIIRSNLLQHITDIDFKQNQIKQNLGMEN